MQDLDFNSDASRKRRRRMSPFTFAFLLILFIIAVPFLGLFTILWGCMEGCKPPAQRSWVFNVLFKK